MVSLVDIILPMVHDTAVTVCYGRPSTIDGTVSIAITSWQFDWRLPIRLANINKGHLGNMIKDGAP